MKGHIVKTLDLRVYAKILMFMAAAIVCAVLYVGTTMLMPGLKEVLVGRIFFRLATLLFIFSFVALGVAWMFGKRYEVSLEKKGVKLMNLKGEVTYVPFSQVEIRGQLKYKLIARMGKHEWVLRYRKAEQVTEFVKMLKKYGVKV